MFFSRLPSAAERTVPGKDCTWEGSYQPRADCTWNFLITNFTNPKARHLQVQSARGAGEFSTLSEKNNVRERLGPERTVPGKTVPEFLTSGTVNLFQVQSAQELYLGLQFSLKPEVEVRPGEVQSAHAPMGTPVGRGTVFSESRILLSGAPLRGA